MKEMTIEEKAKAYDNVVGKLKQFMAQGVDPLITRADVQDFFSELKESEDERIRKELIEFVKSRLAGFPECNRYIAWLGKHGEQKPNYCHHEVDLSGCSEEYRKAYYDGWNNCNQQHSQLRAGQKPAWSEEDENAIGMAIIALDDLYDEDSPDTTYGGYNLPFNKAAERLKSLEDRYTWKPSDEQMNALANARDGKILQLDYLNSLYNDLKKLM